MLRLLSNVIRPKLNIVSVYLSKTTMRHVLAPLKILTSRCTVYGWHHTLIDIRQSDNRLCTRNRGAPRQQGIAERVHWSLSNYSFSLILYFCTRAPHYGIWEIQRSFAIFLQYLYLRHNVRGGLDLSYLPSRYIIDSVLCVRAINVCPCCYIRSRMWRTRVMRTDWYRLLISRERINEYDIVP